MTVPQRTLVKKYAFTASSPSPVYTDSHFLRAKALWEVNADGQIKLTLDADKDMTFPYMPRFGLQLVLPEDQDQVEYIGYGPTESYQDKHRAWLGDRFTTTVDELLEDYVKPQENGSIITVRL